MATADRDAFGKVYINSAPEGALRSVLGLDEHSVQMIVEVRRNYVLDEVATMALLPNLTNDMASQFNYDPAQINFN